MGAAIDPQLANRIAAGRAAWPSVVVEPEVFARYLAERVADCAAPEQALDELHTADLYLACAAALLRERTILRYHYVDGLSIDASPSELRSALRVLDGAVDVDLTLGRALRASGPR